ncbi:uncharacterized protein B0P05DRAFT_536137 [Gilbertella persicaria]|uniref:uncharacterized protein n=1 Tax=Gilbertella persicaria TaxID=101096 RepID=UPI00221E562F|nr:uncharacterized protein B0P05DRAFT_536137 [Gilbertella persicaria]KAI8084092.1 hypothetical protein B0P05DRAFT_536137 [Gilbertella persicaria]
MEYYTNLCGTHLPILEQCSKSLAVVYLNKKKQLEEDKDSEDYKNLCIAVSLIYDFKTWTKEENDLAEGTYVRKFANILDILLEDETVKAYDGEKFSTATSFIQILDENEENSDRRIASITETNHSQINIKLCAIEYKLLSANDSLFIQQQSKNTGVSWATFITSLTKQQAVSYT